MLDWCISQYWLITDQLDWRICCLISKKKIKCQSHTTALFLWLPDATSSSWLKSLLCIVTIGSAVTERSRECSSQLRFFSVPAPECPSFSQSENFRLHLNTPRQHFHLISHFNKRWYRSLTRHREGIILMTLTSFECTLASAKWIECNASWKSSNNKMHSIYIVIPTSLVGFPYPCLLHHFLTHHVFCL